MISAIAFLNRTHVYFILTNSRIIPLIDVISSLINIFKMKLEIESVIQAKEDNAHEMTHSNSKKSFCQ